MLQTREIPRSEWDRFFSFFSQRHDDEPVAIEVQGAKRGIRAEGRDLHLRGISQVQKTRDSAFALMLDTRDGTHLTHMVPRPVHVRVKHNSITDAEILEIQSADGTTTVVRPDRRTRAPRVERFPRKGDDEDISE